MSDKAGAFLCNCPLLIPNRVCDAPLLNGIGTGMGLLRFDPKAVPI